MTKETRKEGLSRKQVLLVQTISSHLDECVENESFENLNAAKIVEDFCTVLAFETKSLDFQLTASDIAKLRTKIYALTSYILHEEKLK